MKTANCIGHHIAKSAKRLEFILKSTFQDTLASSLFIWLVLIGLHSMNYI